MKKLNILKRQKGSTFLVTMVSVFIMSLVGGYSYQLSAHNSAYVNRLQKSMQAHQLAEAGLVRALSTVRSDWTQVSNAGAFPLTTLGTGTYDASVSNIGGRYLVSSVGTVQGVQRTVTAEVVAPSVSALNYVIAGGGTGSHTIDSGTGQSSGTITGDIYMGGPLTIDGPSVGGGGVLAVVGDVYGQSTITDGSNVTVTGSENENWSTTVTFPTVDFSYYQSIATASGQYFDGDKTYASGTLPATPDGGVIFVNGDVTIQGTQATTACIVATGSITMSKTGSTYPRITVNQFSNYPALMTQNGNINFTSTGNGGAYLTVTGLIYSGNNFTVSTGNNDIVTITGSILAKGTYSTSGMTAWNVTGISYASQSPPGFTSSNSTATVRSYNR
jgi:hypothetical protein